MRNKCGGNRHGQLAKLITVRTLIERNKKDQYRDSAVTAPLGDMGSWQGDVIISARKDKPLD